MEQYKKVDKELSDLVNDNIRKLESIFPSVIKDGQVDFEELKELLGDFEEVDKEKYELNWVGKKEAKVVALEPLVCKTLKYIQNEGRCENKTDNLYIEGDNLDALKLLQNSYYEKVKMIYIDPPYNRGSDLIYKDNYRRSKKDEDIMSENLDNNEVRLIKNQRTYGHFHSEWLKFMYSRLVLAKNLLKEDGCIFISIDDNELFNLKKVCDEIFGEHNFINLINCKTKIAGVSGSHLGKSLQNNMEYILCYAKDIDFFKINKAPVKKQELIKYIENMKNQSRSWKYTSVLKNIDDGVYAKSILDGDGNEIKVYKHDKYDICSINSIAKENYNNDIKRAYYENINNIFRTTNAQSSIRSRILNECKEIKNSLISIEYVPNKGKYANKKIRLYYKDEARNLITWLKDVVTIEDNIIYKIDNKGNLWDDLQYNNLTKEGNVKFSNGKKPIQMIKELINMICDEESTILDFFSGSATTAHAVMEHNIESDTNCKYIMVQIDEDLNNSYKIADSENKKSIKETIDFLKSINKPLILSEIGKERIKRAVEQLNTLFSLDALNKDFGFKVFKVDNSNIRWEKQTNENNQFKYDLDGIDADDMDFMPNTKDIDVVYEILLRQYGIPLTAKIDKLDFIGERTYTIENSIIVCLENKITKEIIDKISELDPIKVIFRDSAFGDDISLKQNSIHRLNVLIEKNNKNTTHVVEFI